MMTTTFSPAQQPPQTANPSSAPCATAYRNRAAGYNTYELSDSKSSTPQKNCSSPPNQASHHQPDSDCSSSGLGGMTNPNCCSNSSNSSSLDSDSRDSGGGRSPSQHKSLTATATLTPASLASMQQHGMPIPPLMQPPQMVPVSQLPPHLNPGLPPPVAYAGSAGSKHWVGPPPPPPPMQTHPPLYTMTAATCEGAALAAAAAAAAGYHVSFGLDCWPATTGGAQQQQQQPPTSTGLAAPSGQSSNSAGPNAAGSSSSNSNTAATASEISPPPASNSQSSGIGGSSATTSLTPGLPAGIAAAISGGHDLFVHIHPGDAISLAVGNEIQHIAGPATIRMVSQSTPPSAIPMSVPQGHVVQQLLDRQGLLSHIIMSNDGPNPMSNIGLGSPALASTSSRVSTTGSQQGPPSKTGNSLRSGATTPSHKFPAQQIGSGGHPGQTQPQRGRHNNGNSPKSVSPIPQQSAEMGDNQSAVYQGGLSATPHRNWCSPPNIIHPTGLNVTNPMAGAYISPNNGLLNTGYMASTKRDGSAGGAAVMYPVIDAAQAMSGPAGMTAAYNALMVGNAENDLTHYGIEEDERERLRETLNSLLPPTVTRVGARDAEVVWLELDTSEAAASGGPFPQIDASEFSYEIFVYEGNPPRCVMQHRCSANGTAAGSSSANGPSSPSPSASNGFCCLTRLKPATDYMVNIRASLPERELVGNLSPHTPFRTLPSKPEPVQMPKCLNRQATTATVAWRMPLVNGSHINAYFLQISKGKSGIEPFETCYEGLNEQFRLTNLEPGACYRVRVIARNDFGTSEPSAPLTIYMLHHSNPATAAATAVNSLAYGGAATQQSIQQQHHQNPHRATHQKPAPPTVLSVSARSVRLSWNGNVLSADIISVILEMCDFARASPNIYNPIPNECYSNTFANINGLQSNREYRFRLAATSSHGEIVRSDYVSVKTHKDRYENAAYYNNSGNNQAGNYQQHPQYSAPQPEARVPTPTQLQRLYDDEEMVEIGWKYHGRDYDNVSYVLEAASLPEEGLIGKQQQDWRVCYKGSSSSAAIQDPHLCCFRVQSVNNKRQTSSSWSDTLLVKRHAQRNQKTASKQSSKVHQPQQQQQSTTPVAPVKLVCSTPKFSQIKAYSAKITWRQVPDPTVNRKEQQANELSDVTVASPTNSLVYELQRVDKQPMLIYSGNELEYELKNLRPVEHIQVRLRAILLDAEGKRQEGEWSAVGFACTLCDVSSPPLNLQIQAEPSDSPTTSTPIPKKQSITLIWEVPRQINGSSIQEYVVKASKKSDPESKIEEKIGTSTETSLKISKLAPAEHYTFYVIAVNEAGSSEKSNEVEYESRASVPDAPEHVTAEPISTSEIRLNWNLAKPNGSEVLKYVITVYRIMVVEGQKSQKLEVDELVVGGDEDGVTVNGLETETNYEFTIEAENAIGKGAKERIRSHTLSPPPEPPILSLSQASANCLKLKWCPSASTSTAPAYYYLEKENENGTFSPVYEGELRTAKVKGLKERSVHQFRIRAALAKGVMMGAWSCNFAFNTIRQPPNGIKTAPVVTELSPGVFQVEWTQARCALVGTGAAEEELSGRAQMVYRLQTSPKLGRDKTGVLEPWKTVYEGPSSMCTLPLAGVASTRQARVLVVHKFYGSTNSSEPEEESVSAPSPIAVLSTVRTPTDLSPKKRAKPNGAAQVSPRTGAANALGRQMSTTSSTGPHHKISLYRKLRRFASWLKKTISEKDCALIVLAIFVFLAVGIAVFLNSYYEF